MMMMNTNEYCNNDDDEQQKPSQDLLNLMQIYYFGNFFNEKATGIWKFCSCFHF